MADTYILKNVGLCNVRVNHEKGSWLLVAFGDPVEIPVEVYKLDFVQGLIKSGSVVAEKKSTRTKAKAVADQPESAE